MRLHPHKLAAVIALGLTSCAGSDDEPATTSSTQETTSTTSQDVSADTNTTSTISTSTTNTTQPPAETQSTTTSTATTSTNAPAGSTTETAAPVQSSTTNTTTTTTTSEPAASAQGELTAATAADVNKGLPVFDQKGDLIGKIDSVSGENAVVSTGTVQASVPISSFAKSDKGLVLGMTKAEIEAAAKKK